MKFYLIIVSIITFIIVSIFAFVEIKKEPIKVGVIYSKTGTMAISEKRVLDATLFALEQINQEGGLLGRRVEVIEKDGQSDDKGYIKALNELIASNIHFIFGGWTSSSRKSMKPILEKNDALLFYPIQYEGFENSKNIIYMGLIPNQQIVPTISYAKAKYGKRVYLVGSDYIFPHMANEFVIEASKYLGVDVIATEYRLLGDRNFSDIAENIKALKPSFILNTVNGDSNIGFFKALQDANVSLEQTPVFSLSIDESTFKGIESTLGVKAIEGSYATWGYFDSIEGKENSRLKKSFQKRFGNDILVTDPMYSAYISVLLWADAVRSSGIYSVNEVRKNIIGRSIDAKIGAININHKNNHAWRNVAIAKVDPQGVLKVVWNSESIQEPKPFPAYINTKRMLHVENELYKKWGNRYEAHGGSK